MYLTDNGLLHFIFIHALLSTLKIPGSMWFKMSWKFLVGGCWWSKSSDIAWQVGILDLIPRVQYLGRGAYFVV